MSSDLIGARGCFAARRDGSAVRDLAKVAATLALRRPLVLRGAPGSGKTMVAALLLMGLRAKPGDAFSPFSVRIDGRLVEAPVEPSGRFGSPELQPLRWHRFGDVCRLVKRLIALERRLQTSESSAARVSTSSTDAYRQDGRTVVSAKWWRVLVRGDRTYRYLLRRIEIYLRRLLGVTSAVPTDEDEHYTGIDHSCESHRSRAPGSARKTPIFPVFRELAAV
ncbi:hypothetical protein O7598_27725 [Micromonospora sp. WMMC241]|uniref:hypothetical protein n=1 Tax=Micromonospora sp. WMMC241 TaxID=3015159 RepID=UPI0022B6157E|nr:hypothetical protein [Micromonospora sp. WMMC241]MCZ7440219.1 hypothetical protein [Micromonospora sp. WMMC241]